MEKTNYWQLTSNERRNFWDRSAHIFYAFDGIADRESKTGKGTDIIREMVFQVALKEYDKLLEKIEVDEGEDYIWDFLNPICYSAFAMGYIFGQLFDLPHPSLLKDVEALKKKMKEKHCFAYLPREKKGGSHG